MNRGVHSAECLHRMHSSCDYEDCACECHFEDFEPDPAFLGDDEFDDEDYEDRDDDE